MHFVAAIGHQEQKWLPCDTAAEREQKLQAGFVAPVQVFNDKQQRLRRADVQEELGKHLDQAALFLLRLQRWSWGNRVWQMQSEVWQELHQFRPGRTHIARNLCR